VSTTLVRQPVEQLWLAGTTVHIVAKIAESDLKVSLLKRNMGFVTRRVEDPILPVATVAKINATTTSPVLHVPSLAKLVAIIQIVASCAMSRAFLVQKIVPGPALIGDNVHYLVQFLATYCRAQSAVKTC